jgi:hypothetical protein
MWACEGTTTDGLLDGDRAYQLERDVRRAVLMVHAQLQPSERDDVRLLRRGQERQGERDQSIRHVAKELRRRVGWDAIEICGGSWRGK